MVKKAKINMIVMTPEQTLVMYENIRIQRRQKYLNSSHDKEFDCT